MQRMKVFKEDGFVAVPKFYNPEELSAIAGWSLPGHTLKEEGISSSSASNASSNFFFEIFPVV